MAMMTASLAKVSFDQTQAVDQRFIELLKAINPAGIMKRKIQNIFIAYVLLSASSIAHAEGSLLKELGSLIGNLGTGVGEEIGNSMAKQQPQWITIEPGSKEECIAKAGGVLNNTYMRCRNGRQEQVRIGADGKKVVLNERPIPTH